MSYRAYLKSNITATMSDSFMKLFSCSVMIEQSVWQGFD